MAIGLWIGRIAGRERLDPGAFLGAGLGLERPRPLQRRPGRRDGVGRHRQVNVWPERFGDAPPAHGAVRIQPGGLAERADRLGMVEAEQQVDALVEERLGLRVLGRDRVLVVAQSLEHRCARLVGFAGIDRRHRPHHQHAALLHARHVAHRVGDRDAGQQHGRQGQRRPGLLRTDHVIPPLEGRAELSRAGRQSKAAAWVSSERPGDVCSRRR